MGNLFRKGNILTVFGLQREVDERLSHFEAFQFGDIFVEVVTVDGFGGEAGHQVLQLVDGIVLFHAIKDVMSDKALGMSLNILVAEAVLLLHQCGSDFIERIHRYGIIVVEGLLHHGIEVADLIVKALQLFVVGIEFGLRLRSHDFNLLRVVDVAHNSDIFVVGKERH